MPDLPAFLDDLSLPGDLPPLRLDQVPAEVQNEEDLRRWKMCAGTMWMVCQRPDWRFALEMFRSDLPTGYPQVEPSPLFDE